MKIEILNLLNNYLIAVRKANSCKKYDELIESYAEAIEKMFPKWQTVGIDDPIEEELYLCHQPGYEKSLKIFYYMDGEFIANNRSYTVDRFMLLSDLLKLLPNSLEVEDESN